MDEGIFPSSTSSFSVAMSVTEFVLRWREYVVPPHSSCELIVVIRVGLLEEAAKEIKEVGNEVFYAPCDIREYDIVKKVVKEAAEKLGPITILINCAGG